MNPEIINYFADYADMMFQEYGSKVQMTASRYSRIHTVQCNNTEACQGEIACLRCFI